MKLKAGRESPQQKQPISACRCGCGHRGTLESLPDGYSLGMSASEAGTVGLDGTIEWRDAEGELHRDDGPARVFPSGREEWYRHGALHRENGPAVIHANGSVKYYVDGVRHREDGPACVYVNGTEKWYREGKRHREDGPAAVYPDGRRVWFIEGEKIREERAAPASPRR